MSVLTRFKLVEIMSTSASASCILVWASQCLAFIRYWQWFVIFRSSVQLLLILRNIRLSKHKDSIARLYPEHNRWASSSQGATFLGGLQPGIAGFGLLGSLIIVLVFTSATWWSTPADFRKIAVAYGAVSCPKMTNEMSGLLTYFLPQTSLSYSLFSSSF